MHEVYREKYMPAVFTIDTVIEHLKCARLNTDGDPAELRERLAAHFEFRFQDYVAAWEVRSGRPLSEITREEAAMLCDQHPECVRTPAMLAKVLSDR